MAEEKKFDFWKAAAEANLTMEDWPDWKRNIRLIEYSTGLGKSIPKKDEPVKKRRPIILNSNTVALIQIFTKYDDIDDIWSWVESNASDWEKSAKEFFEQLDGHYSRRFLKSLIKEAQKRLENSKRGER